MSAVRRLSTGCIPLNKEQTDLRHNTVRLHVFTRLICLFHLGLRSLLFPSSLVKLTATRNNFLHNPRELQRAALPCWFEPAKRLLLQISAKKKKIACQKETRQRRTYDFLFNLFLCTISIYYIPHNYNVIPKAMLHAIPQTQSSFYPHRNFSQ